jgi:phosphomannomutase
VRDIYLRNGLNFIDLGIATTPTIQLIAKDFNVLGNSGTASHNPDPWIGYKPLDPKGILSMKNFKLIQEMINSKNDYYEGLLGKKIKFDDLISSSVPIVTNNKALDYHIFKVLSDFDYSTIAKIRSKKYKVVVDHVLGAGHIIIPKLLEHLNCEVVEVYNSKPKKSFPRDFPEPIPENLRKFEKLLLMDAVDIGFAVDPDVDRLVLGVDGKCLSEEYTLAIAIKYFIKKYKSGTVIANLSTSRMGEDIAKEKGWKFIRTPVGERNVLDEIISQEALIGGEGNGGIINPNITPGRDAIYGIVLVLAYMAESSLSLVSIVEDLPKYCMIKTKIHYEDGINLDDVIDKARKLIVPESLGSFVSENNQDGLRMDYEKGWVHLRGSNTEPIIRIIAEAKSDNDMRELVTRIRALF